MLLGAIGASLLRAISRGKGTFGAGKGAISQVKNFNAAY